MKYAAILMFPFLVLIAGCDQQAKHDSAMLDSILATRKIDTLEFISLAATNVVTGKKVQEIVAIINKTNRITDTFLLKQHMQDVTFLDGTNRVCVLSLWGNGVWQFGAYDFRLQQGATISAFPRN